MTKTRSRSPSQDGEGPSIKRHKTTHLSSSTLSSTTDPLEYDQDSVDACHSTASLVLSNDKSHSFSDEPFDPNNISRLNLDYHRSTPFKYAVVEKLFQDDLLRKVKDECLSELNFTEKETDIYKV
jgi:hypothetical protein